MANKNEAVARHQRYQTALDNAYAAASEAQKGLVENMNAFDCGFAWVVTRDLAFNTWCRKQGKELVAKGDHRSARRYGSKHYAGGWSFWCPGNFNGQSVGIHEKGAKAFSETLARELGFYVEHSSRLD